MLDASTTSLESMSFTIEGEVNVLITITELASGDLQFDIKVLDDTGSLGDLQGLFFDVLDPSVLDGLVVSGDDVTADQFDEGDVDNLGGGVNIKGELTQDDGFDGGIRFGTSGMAKDDIQETSFTLSHSSEELTLDDFYGADFGVRLTSVGEEDGSRDDSLKLGGTAPEAPEDDTTPPTDDDPDQPPQDGEDPDGTDDPDGPYPDGDDPDWGGDPDGPNPDGDDPDWNGDPDGPSPDGEDLDWNVEPDQPPQDGYEETSDEPESVLIVPDDPMAALSDGTVYDEVDAVDSLDGDQTDDTYDMW